MDEQEHSSSAEEEKQAAHRAALEALIAARLRDAVQAREMSAIEDIWLEDEDQYNGYDELNRATAGVGRTKETSTVDKKTSTRSTVFLNITKPKTQTAVSRVQEMLLPTDDKPWELAPTPVPELLKAAAGEDQRMIPLADGTEASADVVAKATIAKAQKASDQMAAQFEDWFVEGDVYSQMRLVIQDAGRIGTGVLKGPFPVARKDRKWSIKGGASVLEVAERIAPTSRRIDPWDLFPDPSCGDDIHAGGYLLERDYMTGRKLRELARVPGYDRQALAEVLLEGPKRRARYDRYYREQPGETPSFDTGTFEVFYYYGDIPPEDLIACGYDVKGLVDAEEPGERKLQADLAMQLTTVAVTVTLVNDRIVRVSMNPLETGEFPFDVFPWEAVDGQPWGRGIPRKMAAAQKMLNAATRAMLENAGMSKGPQLIITKDAIEPWDGKYEVTGRKGWYFKPNEQIDDVRKAFASVMIESAQQQLQAIIDFALKMADELSNLPLLLQGIVGNAPETLGGQQLAQANASAPLKTIAKQFDDRLIVPHLKRYYAWGMQDPSVPTDAKGDMQCKARGASALATREQAAVFYSQALELAKDPMNPFRINPDKAFAEMARANKANLSAIQYTDDEWKQLQDQAGQQQPPQDPRIAAAQINSDAKKAQIDANAANAEADRKFKAWQADVERTASLMVAEIQREIQTMEFAAQREVSLDQVKAMLTKAAMEIRNKRDLFDAEAQLALTKGEGI